MSALPPYDEPDIAHLLVDNIHSFVGLLSPDGVLLEANSTALRAANLQRDDVIGKRFWDCYWWSYSPAVVERLKIAVRAAAAGEAVRYSTPIRIGEGQLIDIDFSLVPVRDENGRVQHLIPSGIDISAERAAETAQRQSQALSQSILEHSSDCIKVLDLDGKLVDMNGPGLCIMQIDDFATVAGEYWYQFWPQEQQEFVQNQFLQARAGHNSRFQGDCSTAKGTVKTWDVVLTPILDDRQDVTQVLCISRDITQLLKQQAELQERESSFRILANNISQLAWMADNTGWIFWYNQRWFDYTGKSFEEMQGWGWRSVHHPEHVERVVEKISGCFQSGRDWEDIFPLCSKDGEYRWFLSRMKSIRDDHGQIVRWFGTNTDVTDSLRVEDELRKSEQKLQLGIDVAQVGIAEIDYRLQTVKLSKLAANIYGFPIEDLVVSRQQLHDLVHPKDRDSFEQHVRDALQSEGGATFSIEHRIVRPSGQVRWINLRKHVFATSENGTITASHALLALQDITEQKENEEELSKARIAAEAASRAKSDFLANMSHEIRSPMTAILGYAELLKGLTLEDRQHIETIQRNGQFLLTLINDILDLSKIESGKLEIVEAQFSPAVLVEEVVSLMHVRAVENNIQLRSELSTNLPSLITSDPIRVRQILINLVGNAIKFTQRGHVHIVAEFDGSAQVLRFDIVDTGIGIHEEMLARLFLPFEQADSTTARDYGGSGLGLAISARLAKLLQARIDATSKLGEGSRFSLHLPVQVPSQSNLKQETNVASSAKSPEEPIKHLPIHVLVADDRRDIRFLVKSLVERAGGQATICENGQEALDCIRQEDIQNPFDVVLMDMQMPVMDGLTAIRELRNSGFDRPVVALTANAMESDREACIANGFNDYISKPVNANRLLQLLQSLLTSER